MSNYRMDPLEYSSPPPAYNDREFEQKTSLATEASLQTPRPPTPEISEERWAEIEEAAFQAALAASLADSQGQSSRSIEPGPPSPTRSRSPVPYTAPRRFPTVKPLRIEKKTRSPNASVDLKNEKENAKWLSEEESRSYPSQAGSSQGHGDYEDDIAPPPFAETAPHGSQYHEPDYHDGGYDPPHSAGHPSTGSLPDISPNSLLTSLDSLSISSALISDNQPTARPPPHLAVQSPPPPASSHGCNRQSMPVSPAQEPTAYRTVHRTRSFTPQPSSSFVDPSSTHHARGAINAPMVHFNPSVAYGKSPFARLQTPPPSGMEETQEVVYRANAFYNAAVSAHLTPKTPNQRSTGDQRPSYARTHSTNGYGNSHGNSYSTASSPGYASMSNQPGTNPGHQHPYTAAPTPTDPNWGQPYPGSNRPMSVHSMDTVYSNSAVSQPQYLNTFQPTPRHSGVPPSSWAAAGSQQYEANRYGHW